MTTISRENKLISESAKSNGPAAYRPHTDVVMIRHSVQPLDQILPRIPVDIEPKIMSNPPPPSSQTPVIALENAHLSLGSDAASVHILKGISLHIDAGESVGILGPSGAGKTSLLMVLAGLETLSNGQILLDGTDITGLDEDRLAALRRDLVGIVFQAFRLIPSLTALQNVTIPLELAGHDYADDMAKAALQSVGLAHRLSHLPDQMSGGEQQRVAIARAMVAKPRILLADEPTGNLDSVTGEKVIKSLFQSAADANAALVLVTHDANLAAQCSRVLHIEDGVIVNDSKSAS
jgi:putative ABC transport system ATP-binding protein